mmetsp:Transcript_21282/g.50323  ORF Transcript_21282/g.50323 Transcript_21282/m.50323 type:complete len:399 (-) Transcript_21282:124-1320(-)
MIVQNLLDFRHGLDTHTFQFFFVAGPAVPQLFLHFGCFLFRTFVVALEVVSFSLDPIIYQPAFVQLQCCRFPFALQVLPLRLDRLQLVFHAPDAVGYFSFFGILFLVLGIFLQALPLEFLGESGQFLYLFIILRLRMVRRCWSRPFPAATRSRTRLLALRSVLSTAHLAFVCDAVRSFTERTNRRRFCQIYETGIGRFCRSLCNALIRFVAIVVQRPRRFSAILIVVANGIIFNGGQTDIVLSPKTTVCSTQRSYIQIKPNAILCLDVARRAFHRTVHPRGLPHTKTFIVEEMPTRNGRPNMVSILSTPAAPGGIIIAIRRWILIDGFEADWAILSILRRVHWFGIQARVRVRVRIRVRARAERRFAHADPIFTERHRYVCVVPPMLQAILDGVGSSV